MTEKPTKKETDIFKAIKEDDFEEVKRLVEWQPELVRAVVPKKPAETMGMSPLQVALNTGWHREIAWFLLENGADVNYMAGPEYKLYGSSVGYPVLFDAVCSAVRNARRYVQDPKTGEFRWVHTKEEADISFSFLKRMIELGADVNKTDYDGRNSLMEAVAEANKLCPIVNPETGRLYESLPITPAMTDDLRRIFKLLIDSGADLDNTSAYSKKNIREHYSAETIWRICGDLFEQPSLSK